MVSGAARPRRGPACDCHGKNLPRRQVAESVDRERRRGLESLYFREAHLQTETCMTHRIKLQAMCLRGDVMTAGHVRPDLPPATASDRATALGSGAAELAEVSQHAAKVAFRSALAVTIVTCD